MLRKPNFTSSLSRIKLAFGLLVISVIMWTSICYASQPPLKKQMIVDLATMMHIASVGNLKQDGVYLVNGAPEVCLLFTNKTSGVWDLKLNKLFVSPGPLCALPDGAQRVGLDLDQNAAQPFGQGFVQRVGEGGPPPGGLSSPIIYEVYDPSIEANCGSILGDHYVIFYPDGHTYAFYLVGRLSKPEIFVKSSMCDYMMGKTETVHSAWTEKFTTGYVPLTQNRVILYDYPVHQFESQTVLMIPPTMGDQVISISHLAYVIPADRLEPLLNKVGFDPIARNEVLQQFIQAHLEGDISIP